MPKQTHEVRCGVHGFLRFGNLERQLIDSGPMQRLRDIHQLALTYQVYPGATHRRFEHSLGVMEFATRVFDSVFTRDKLDDAVRERLGDDLDDDALSYWRRVVRVAGLLHDVGHLPFSHAAENLLPAGWDHERVTADIIRHSEIATILQSASSPIRPDDVVDLCWEPKKRAKAEPNASLSVHKTVLSELITGNTFGADRIDYLLRDGIHAGVPYGRFGPDRLIQGLRLVVDPETDNLAVGLDYGSIHAAEALLLARYFMYTQVYLHDVRRAYDVHLKDFLRAWLPGGHYPTDWRELMKTTDCEVLSQLRVAAADSTNSLHALARRVVGREHYRTVFEAKGRQFVRGEEVLNEVCQRLESEFGADAVRSDWMAPKAEVNTFPVIDDEGQIMPSVEVSHVISQIPPVGLGLVFVPGDRLVRAKKIVAELMSKPIHLPVEETESTDA